MFRLQRDRIEQSVLSVRDQVSDKAFEIVEEICLADSFKFGRSQSYKPVSKAIENGLTRILNYRVAGAFPEQTFTDEELLEVVSGRSSTGDVELDDAIKEEYDEWKILICRFILLRIDERIDRQLPSDTVEIITRFKDERFYLHDRWADYYEFVIRVREMPRYIAKDDLPGQVKWLSSQERLYRKVGDDFRQGVLQRLRDETQEKLNDEINYISHQKILGAAEMSDAQAKPLPPLVEIMNERKNSARRVILLIDELLPGFFDKSKSGTINGDITDKRKALFISLMSNKTHGTYKRAFSELNQASYQSSEYRDDIEWAKQQAAKLAGTDDE